MSHIASQDHNESTMHSVLERLDLSPEQMQALRRQGFVSEESRHGRTIFKLRFRMARRQFVKHLGTDVLFAQAVREQLRAFQMERTSLRELNEVARKARAVIRDFNRRLQPYLEAAGMCFHGHAIRRKRGRKAR